MSTGYNLKLRHYPRAHFRSDARHENNASRNPAKVGAISQHTKKTCGLNITRNKCTHEGRNSERRNDPSLAHSGDDEVTEEDV